MKLDKNSIVLPLPTDELINEWERLYRVKYPHSYREFLKKYNGAESLDYTGTFMANNEHEYVIDRWLCLLDKPNESNSGMYDMGVVLSQVGERMTAAEHADELGSYVIPIAVLFAGDFLCLDFRKDKERAKVIVWDHEDSDEFEPVFYQAANSFDEFMKIVK